MPPKKDGAAPNDGQKKEKKTRRKDNMKKIKDDRPIRTRKTERVILHQQARDMVAKVYDFMKKEAVTKYCEKMTDARWRTATAVGISEKTVSRILSERNKKKAAAGATAATAVTVGAVATGKLNAVGDLGHSVGDVLTVDFAGQTDEIGNTLGSDITGAIDDLGNAAVIGAGGDPAPIGTIVNGTFSILGR